MKTALLAHTREPLSSEVRHRLFLYCSDTWRVKDDSFWGWRDGPPRDDIARYSLVSARGRPDRASAELVLGANGGATQGGARPGQKGRRALCRPRAAVCCARWAQAHAAHVRRSGPSDGERVGVPQCASGPHQTHRPAMTVPCGMINGLPVGLMLIGKDCDKPTIYRAAYAFEQAGDEKAR